MNTDERIKNWKVHKSMRGHFAYELYKRMAKNKDIILLTGDLGYGMFDNHKEDMPDQFINCGASEFAMMGIACGLALKGKIPFVYSITPFLLYRPFEMLRTYVNHEKIPVRLIGGGRDTDYTHDGYSHNAEDALTVLKTLPNIVRAFPETNDTLPMIVDDMVASERPYFISLRR